MSLERSNRKLIDITQTYHHDDASELEITGDTHSWCISNSSRDTITDLQVKLCSTDNRVG
jgi:hypothetical protein